MLTLDWVKCASEVERAAVAGDGEAYCIKKNGAEKERLRERLSTDSAQLS